MSIQNNITFDDLPDDVVSIIMSFSKPNDIILRLSIVNKRLNILTKENTTWTNSVYSRKIIILNIYKNLKILSGCFPELRRNPPTCYLKYIEPNSLDLTPSRIIFAGHCECKRTLVLVIYDKICGRNLGINIDKRISLAKINNGLLKGKSIIIGLYGNSIINNIINNDSDIAIVFRIHKLVNTQRIIRDLNSL